jgi:hypothetical protein
MIYPNMLHRRFDQASPRESHEVVSGYLDELNAAALKAWRKRWAEHRSLPDAESPRTRRLLNAYFDLHRMCAFGFLASLAARRRLSAASPKNVITLKIGRKP